MKTLLITTPRSMEQVFIQMLAPNRYRVTIWNVKHGWESVMPANRVRSYLQANIPTTHVNDPTRNNYTLRQLVIDKLPVQFGTGW